MIRPMTLLGLWMRQRRLKKGATQAAAAELTGMTAGAWSLIEEGRRGQSLEYGTMKKLAPYLGRSVDEVDEAGKTPHAEEPRTEAATAR